MTCPSVLRQQIRTVTCFHRPPRPVLLVRTTQKKRHGRRVYGQDAAWNLASRWGGETEDDGCSFVWVSVLILSSFFNYDWMVEPFCKMGQPINSRFFALSGRCLLPSTLCPNRQCGSDVRYLIYVFINEHYPMIRPLFPDTTYCGPSFSNYKSFSKYISHTLIQLHNKQQQDPKMKLSLAAFLALGKHSVELVEFVGWLWSICWSMTRQRHRDYGSTKLSHYSHHFFVVVVN